VWSGCFTFFFRGCARADDSASSGGTPTARRIE
jgi:hypothetical protein